MMIKSHDMCLIINGEKTQYMVVSTKVYQQTRITADHVKFERVTSFETSPSKSIRRQQ